MTCSRKCVDRMCEYVITGGRSHWKQDFLSKNIWWLMIDRICVCDDQDEMPIKMQNPGIVPKYRYGTVQVRPNSPQNRSWIILICYHSLITHTVALVVQKWNDVLFIKLRWIKLCTDKLKPVSKCPLFAI